MNGIKTVTSHQSVQDYFSTKLSAAKRKTVMSVKTNRTVGQCPEQAVDGLKVEKEKMNEERARKRIQKKKVINHR